MTKINFNYNGPLKVGIGGPVGSGKTTLINKADKIDFLMLEYEKKKPC